MLLEIGTFPVREVVFGSATRWHDGVLELNHDELLRPVVEQPEILKAKLEVAKPGESARIIHYFDILEPRIKVRGQGSTYPGRCGRAVDIVGDGRTHRLSGLSVIVCEDNPNEWGTDWNTDPKEIVPRPYRANVWTWQKFVEMSGPGAILPQSRTINVCLSVRLKDGLNASDRANVIHAAALGLQDRLAATTALLEPPELEEFDLRKKTPGLPGIVFICLLASMEIRVGPRSPSGTAIYGVTRLSAPWVLGPTEMMDGAVTGGGAHSTWPLTNNPIVLELCRRHGKTINFLGCLIGRTNWGGEEEMVLSGSRSAKAASLMGAQGAIITNDVRGRRFVDSVRTIQACERIGIKTVFVGEEEDNENGNAPAFLYHPPEMSAVVSTGTGAAGPFPPVKRVIGSVNGVDPAWYGQVPDVAGRYGAAHVRDHYGVGNQSYVDY